MRTIVTDGITNQSWPVLGIAARTQEIETSVIPQANEMLQSYGVRLVRLGNFTISLSEQDQLELKKFRRDVSYTKLAGGFTQYGTGSVLLGIGEGASHSTDGGQGTLLGAGLGIGNLIGMVGAGAAAQSTANPIKEPETKTRFCSSCGSPAVEQAVFCSSCGHHL